MRPKKLLEAEELFQLMRVTFITITTGRDRHELGLEPPFQQRSTLRIHHVSALRKLRHNVLNIMRDICPPIDVASGK